MRKIVNAEETSYKNNLTVIPRSCQENVPVREREACVSRYLDSKRTRGVRGGFRNDGRLMR